MASSYSTSLGIEKMATGDQSGTWGTTSNHNWDIIDRITAYTSVAITTNADTATLTVREASPESGTENLQDGMYRVIKFTGALDSTCTVTIAPNTAKVFFIIINATTDSGSSGPYSIILTQGSGANVTVQNGNSAVVYCDGAGGGAAVTDALSDLQIGNDLSLVSDSAVLNMGANNDITVTHVADVGLKLKQAGATGDGNPFVLTLQTGELDIAADDVLGQIDFQAPDEATGTDAILVAAGISAISEGDFSSSSNATKLSFKTGASEAATEKMHITSVGNVNMKNTATGDDTPMVLTLQTGETDIASADVLGQIDFQAPDEGAGTDAILVAAGIAAVSEGDFSSSNNATKLSFKTAASAAAAETMSLSSAGLLTVADDIVFKDGGTIGVSSAIDAMTVSSAGIVTFKDDILIKDGGTIGVTSAIDAMTVSSAGIVTFKDDILIKDGGTIGVASANTAMTVASTGAVTMPLQPSFRATLAAQAANVTGNGTVYTVVWDTETWDIGGNFNNSTGVFTAPITGKYFFTTHCYMAGATSTPTYGDIKFVTSNRTHAHRMWDFGNSGGPGGMTFSILADLDASDTCYVTVAVGGQGSDILDIEGGDTLSWFSGCLQH
jgi:hypothetical protein